LLSLFLYIIFFDCRGTCSAKSIPKTLLDVEIE